MWNRFYLSNEITTILKNIPYDSVTSLCCLYFLNIEKYRTIRFWTNVQNISELLLLLLLIRYWFCVYCFSSSMPFARYYGIH